MSQASQATEITISRPANPSSVKFLATCLTCGHVRAVAPLVLRHRIMTNFHGEAEGMTPERIVKELLQHVSEPRPEDYK